MRRLARLLVGEADVDGSSSATDPDVPTAEHIAALETRIQQLEQGVRLIAGTLRRSHSDLSREMRNLRAGSQEGERITRAEVQRMLWEAMGPLASAVERMNESVRGLPLVMNASAERLLDKAARPDEARPQRSADAIPARPFELEPLEQASGDA